MSGNGLSRRNYVWRGFLSKGVLSGNGLCLEGVMYGGGFVRGVLSEGGFVRGFFVQRGFVNHFNMINFTGI